MGRYRRCLSINELPRLDLRDRKTRRDVRLLAAGLEQYFVRTWFPWKLGVRVTLTPCRFGGHRPWFVCAGCGHKRLVLYFIQYGWRCRACLHMVHPSQRASRDFLRTGQLRVQALYRRFYSSWSYGDPEPLKPPRVRWRTWARLTNAVESWEKWINARWCPRVLRQMGIGFTRSPKGRLRG